MLEGSKNPATTPVGATSAQQNSSYPDIPEVNLSNGIRYIAAVEKAIYGIRSIDKEGRRLVLGAFAYALKSTYDSVIKLRETLEKEGEL